MLARFLFAALVASGTASLAIAQSAGRPGDWPQWRGPARDGVSAETGLLKEWPKAGPPVAWQVDTVGVGYSSLSAKDGRLFTIGDLNGVEHVICLSAADGKTLWAMQPEPVAKLLSERLAKEMERLDKNKDGEIDEAEGLAGLGWRTFNDADADQSAADDAALRDARVADRVRRLLKLLDKNSDGRLDYAEAVNGFRDVFSNIDQTDPQADAAALAKARTKAFLAAQDADRNGQIDQKESRNSLLERNFGRIDKPDPATNKGDQLLTAEEIEAYLAKNEAGRDGGLSQAELLKYYGQNLARGDGILKAGDLSLIYGGYRNGMGDGPRGTPAVDGDRVYAEGGNGDLVCLDAASGKTIWHVNLSRDLGGGVPGWGYSESPLIVGDQVVVTPGGSKGTLAGLNKLTGEVVWRSAEVKQSAHYASPIVAELAGVKQIVQFGSKSCFAVSLDGQKLLWDYPGAANGTANAATPIAYKDHVFSSSAYGTGGGLVKISAQGEAQQATQVYFEKKMANHHGGIVRVGEYMYGFGNNGLMCMNFLTGEIAWTARSVSKGSLVAADGMLYLLGEGHQVALAEVNPKEYVEKGNFKIDSFGKPSWAHPIVAGGRFYVRNQQRLTAYTVTNVQ